MPPARAPGARAPVANAECAWPGRMKSRTRGRRRPTMDQQKQNLRCALRPFGHLMIGDAHTSPSCRSVRPPSRVYPVAAARQRVCPKRGRDLWVRSNNKEPVSVMRAFHKRALMREGRLELLNAPTQAIHRLASGRGGLTIPARCRSPLNWSAEIGSAQGD